MNQKQLGIVVEIAGALGVVGGAVAGFHHLAFSLPCLIGVVAIYVGRKMAAGTVAL